MTTRIQVALLVSLLFCSTAAAQQYNGVFTSPWYGPSQTLQSATPLCVGSATCVSQTVQNWRTELADMRSAGLDFFAVYSFGTPYPNGPWADPVNFAPNMVQAILAENASGNPIKVAYFHDTNGNPIRAQAACGFDLAGGEAYVKQYVYTGNIKAFFDKVPPDAQFRVGNRPVLFMYVSHPLFRSRDLLGLLLTKIKEWFLADFQVEPLIVVEKDWVLSAADNPNTPCNEASTVPQATVDLVRQKADAFYSWDFSGVAGTNGVLISGGYPGGGVVQTHPLNGITVGTANPGYYFCNPPSTSPCTVTHHRSRQNGLTLTNDWNQIRNASLRMIAAWWDFDEDSGISRTTAEGDKYIKLTKQLITPVTPTLASFGPASGPFYSGVAATINAVGTAFLPGAVVEFAPYPSATPVTALSVTYVSPTLMQFSYTGGAPPGQYYVRIRNSDGTVSAPIVITVV